MKKVYLIMKAVEGMDIVMDVYEDANKRDERLNFYAEHGISNGIYYKLDMELSD